jgi:hypothetical protein
MPDAQAPLQPLKQTACLASTSQSSLTDVAAVDPAEPPAACPFVQINTIDVDPLNETDSLLRLRISAPADGERRKLLLLVGNKVFGLKDAPVWRQEADGVVAVVATVPTALLLSSRTVRVFAPFWSDVDGSGSKCYEATARVPNVAPDSATERLVLVSVSKAGDATYILYGNGLYAATLIVPDRNLATLKGLDHVSSDRMLLLTVKKAALANTKKVVLQKEDGSRPLLLDLPAVKPTPITVSADSPVIQGTDELDVSAERIADITAVKFKDKPLPWKPVDKSTTTIHLVGLKAAGVTSQQQSCEITIEYRNGDKATLKLEVVAARVAVQLPDKSANPTSAAAAQQ